MYCAIGQRASSVAKVVAELIQSGAMDHTVVMVTEGNDAPGLKYIAPYAATAIAEHFMDKGRDILIVYDDLTQHARAYRELSLLSAEAAWPRSVSRRHLLSPRTTPGTCHASRSTTRRRSLTALPIVETEAQNISAYLPTNLISITDGQIYLSPTLFEFGVLPAIDVAKSVSRVGGKAQFPAYRNVTGALKLAYAQFEELEHSRASVPDWTIKRNDSSAWTTNSVLSEAATVSIRYRTGTNRGIPCSDCRGFRSSAARACC